MVFERDGLVDHRTSLSLELTSHSASITISTVIILSDTLLRLQHFSKTSKAIQSALATLPCQLTPICWTGTARRVYFLGRLDFVDVYFITGLSRHR